MALLFADGFDNYDTLTDFWDFAVGVINTTPGVPRTGRGCLQITTINGAGPIKSFGQQVTHVLFCTGCNYTAGGTVWYVRGSTQFGDPLISVGINNDGSVYFYMSPNAGGPRYTTAAGLYHFGTWNSIAAEIENFNPTTGIIILWVNGVQALRLTGINTYYYNRSYCDGVQLLGAPAAGALSLHDDFYCLDCSTAPNNTFLGALKLYSIPPTANGAVAWVPLAGTNWSEVNEVPPDGDTSYNSSATPGQIDQYVYPLTGPPAGSSIAFVQHELDMEVDSGSRSVASDVNGIINAAATALPNGYHIYPTPYDLNPSTGLPWVAGDFPVNAGPAVTA